MAKDISRTEAEKSLAEIREGLEMSSTPEQWPGEAGRELMVLYDIATGLKLDLENVLGPVALSWLRLQVG